MHAASTAPSRDFDLRLVLSGGNALGAFQGGVYEALHDMGLRPDWVVGASIGAINGALIAGTDPHRRIETLRAFWRSGSIGPSFGAQPASHPAFAMAETWRRSTAALGTIAGGRTGLFGPLLSALLPWTDPRPSLFETDQMTWMLGRLVDFDRLNGGGCRYTATAVDLETGADVAFDSRRQRIEAGHIRASAALPILFPPVAIDGRTYVDGGLSANLPLDPALSEPTDRPLLCVAVDLVPLRQPLPRTLGEIASRSQDLAFGAQSRRTIERWKASLAGCTDRRITLLRIAYADQEDEVAAKAFDFSERTVARRWAAGSRAAEAAMARVNGNSPVDRPGLTVFDAEEASKATLE